MKVVRCLLLAGVGQIAGLWRGGGGWEDSIEVLVAEDDVGIDEDEPP